MNANSKLNQNVMDVIKLRLYQRIRYISPQFIRGLENPSLREQLLQEPSTITFDALAKKVVVLEALRIKSKVLSKPTEST